MDYQEQIKEREVLKNEWLDRKSFFELKAVVADSPGKQFELEKEIEICIQKINKIDEEIESLNNKIKRQRELLKDKIRRNISDVWEQLNQKFQSIDIQEDLITAFVFKEITEPIVTFQWKESVFLLLAQLNSQSFQINSSERVTIDYAINRLLKLNQTERHSRALAIFVMEFLVEEAKVNLLKDETVRYIISYAIRNINENDGRFIKPSTRIDIAFNKLLSLSYFSEICKVILIQDYISADDEHRTRIGCIFVYSQKSAEILNTKNSAHKLQPLLEKLIQERLVEKRVRAALRLVNMFFVPHLNNNLIEIDFLPEELLNLTIKVLLKVISEDVIESNAVSSTAIWALQWLTASSGRASNYTVYNFPETQLDTLRKFATDNKQGTIARGRAVSILSRCNSNFEQTVFAQADWIYEWANVADGIKPQKQLPVMIPLNRPQDIELLKDLINSDLPIEGKCSVAIALGRLGCFVEEMIEPLLEIFQDEMAIFSERDEALVYLSFIRNSKVISKLGQEAQEPFEKDSKKYDLSGRCFLALMGIGNLQELQYRLVHSTSEQSQINAYAYGLAGNVNSQGLEILNSLKNHQKKQVREAVNNALSKVKQWDASNSNQISYDSSGSNNEDRFLAQQGHLIHKLKAKDSTGRWAYYFVYVEPRNEKAFLNALDSNKSIDLEDYGKVVGSCYGEKPDRKLRNLLKQKYGFEV